MELWSFLYPPPFTTLICSTIRNVIFLKFIESIWIYETHIFVLRKIHCVVRALQDPSNSRVALWKVWPLKDSIHVCFSRAQERYIPLFNDIGAVCWPIFILQEIILQDSGKNKEALLAAKREFESTRDAVNLFSNQFFAIVDQVRM